MPTLGPAFVVRFVRPRPGQAAEFDSVQSLLATAPAQRLVLIIDQLEELFCRARAANSRTFCQDGGAQRCLRRAGAGASADFSRS